MKDEKDREIARLKQKLGEAEGFQREVFGLLGIQWWDGCKCHSPVQDIIRRKEDARRCAQQALWEIIDRIQKGGDPATLIEDVREMAVNGSAAYP
jgi:hypothetical protein